MIATYAFTHTELKDGWTAVGNKYVPFNPTSSIGPGVVFGGALNNFVASVPQKVFITKEEHVLGVLKRVAGTETPWKHVYIHAGEVDPELLPKCCFLMPVHMDEKGYIRCMTPYARPLFIGPTGRLELYASFQHYWDDVTNAVFAPVETEEDIAFDEKVRVQSIRIYEDDVGRGAVYYSTLMGLRFATVVHSNGIRYKFEYLPDGRVMVSKLFSPSDKEETTPLDISKEAGAALAAELDPTLKADYMSADAASAKYAAAKERVLKQVASLGIKIPGRDTLKRIGVEGPY